MAPHVLKYNWAVMTAEMQQDIREAFNGSSTEEPHKQGLLKTKLIYESNVRIP